MGVDGMDGLCKTIWIILAMFFSSFPSSSSEYVCLTVNMHVSIIHSSADTPAAFG